jgi:bacteriocin biosynthesis cyclodehydratase domain-containing protein
MKGDPGDGGVIQFDIDEVPQFAPNFSIYTLPPDVVCLYSEHRKFFLHGELYCALAAKIAAGARLRELVRELERDFPKAEIQEALRRLLERRFVLPTARSRGGAGAAYWASLGLPPETAERNLQGFRARIRSVDVPGASELGAALRELGVRLVERSADLTVTLVDDYLEARLADLNRRHLSNETSWLLVQLSGVFPLVGPVFRPGHGPCWTCLADRMKRNREVRAFLNRKHARCLVASPLARQIVGQSAVQLAAVEIAKAIATSFRTDLRDHVISLDLMGSTIARHYVPTRPQCPACGRDELRNPNRAPMPVELGDGGKLVMTSGGYRTVSPATTLARFRKHVSPLTGVVSRLERMEADLALNASYVASHNFSPRPDTVDELRAGLSGDSYGKGSTAEQAEASALMEAIERYSGVFQDDEIRVTRRFTDFPPAQAITPNEVMLFSDAQYRQDQAPMAAEDDASPPPARFDPSALIEWSPAWSLRDRCFKYFPTSLLYYFHNGAGADQTSADSNGCAAGNTLEEAILQGFLELVERDSYAIWWYNRLQRPELDLDQIDDSYIRDLRTQLKDAGRQLWVLDVTSDLGIPSYVAISHWKEDAQEYLEFGSGAHFDPRIAALRAITELNQFFSISLMTRRNAQASGSHGPCPWRLDEHAYFLPSATRAVPPATRANFGHLDHRAQVLACVELVKREGLDFLVLNQTRPDIGAPVARVIVPGMRHFYRRFAPGRLYDVPVKLGLRDSPIPESELNPYLPPT